MWEAHLPHLATPAKADTPTRDVSARCDPAEKVSPWTMSLRHCEKRDNESA